MKPITWGFRLADGVGAAAMHTALVLEDKHAWGLITLAVSEAFPTGLFKDIALRWAAVERKGGPWMAPPPGWISEPANSQDAGLCLH